MRWWWAKRKEKKRAAEEQARRERQAAEEQVRREKQAADWQAQRENPAGDEQAQREKLLQAAWKGDVDTVRKLLATRKVDVDGVRDKGGYSALHIAASRGHAPVVELLLKAGATVDAAGQIGRSALHLAALRGHDLVVELLLKAGATVDAVTPDGSIVLYGAASRGHAPVVKLLLKAGSTVDALNQDGSTALHGAAENGQAPAVELLLKAGATVDAAGQIGRSALHLAALRGHDLVVELLLKAGTRVDATDRDGKTPLNAACEGHQPSTTSVLLNNNANLHAKDKHGLAPLHKLLKATDYPQLNTDTLRTLQVLVAFSATWDPQCDHLVAAKQAWKEATALRLCMSLWAQEHADGLELSDVPIEIVKRSVESTQGYIESRKRSAQLVLRRKICLVGPSCAGKTSFVKSITANVPQLEHVDDRTIGIDHFPLQFKQQGHDQEKLKTHEVTFWDFAGQDAYQVAHSLFFSPRTLYFVFVDLQAFTIAYKQAVIFADDDSQKPKLLDEFFEYSVRQWMQLIVARHPDAEFVFIATKVDLLQENEHLRSLLKQELNRRFQSVWTEVHKMKAAEEDNIEPTIMYASCLSRASVQAARAQIKALVIKSNYSFPMTDEYSSVLNAILKIRDKARHDSPSEQITRTFAPVTQLLTELVALQIDRDLCCIILQTLHDIGDVLWYENLNIDPFHETIILDPLLLIDFIRQVITHEHTGFKMSHADLEGKPFWRSLGDDDGLMKAMKQLMQSFHLVYSAAEDRVMAWDSHLIVPAYWKSREPVARRFPSGDLLMATIGSSEGGLPPRVRVRWDYHFKCGLPSTVFDHFVVACVSPLYKFDAGPDWLLYEGGSGFTGCRVLIGRDRRSLHRTIHVEAVVADDASSAHESDLWGHFRQFAGALVLILREHKGLGVACNAWDDAGRELELKGLLSLTDPPERPTWMPPVAMWASLRL